MTLTVPLLFALLGAILASLAGVIAERLNTGESWTRGRSRCNSCSRTLSTLDLIPIVSWTLSRGRCRTCSARIPALYAITEVVLAVLFLFSYVKEGLTLSLVLLLLSLFILTIIVLYDLRHTVVPFMLSMLLAVSTFVYALLAPATELAPTLITAGCIGLGFFLLHVLSGGRAMGLGDAPVALALALLAGPLAFSGLLYSFWIGAVIGIGILVRTEKGHRMGIEVPFVPFLAIGFLLAFFTQWNILAFL